MTIPSNAPIQIKGGNSLHGKVRVQGSKNASLPVLAASILIKGNCLLHNCPQITDILYMQKLLECAGCHVERIRDTLSVDAGDVTEYRLPGSYVGMMRSSVILMGAMLGRMGKVGIDYPGGCVIGSRPIDLHLMALEKLGAVITTEGNYIFARASQLKGAEIVFPFSSVGATQNAILAAVTANGITVIHNAAREPEISTLCEFLNHAGADIDGIGTSRLVINGVDSLHAVEYHIPSDRIVAGTYLFAVMAAGGRIVLEKIPTAQLDAVLKILRQMGAEITLCSDGYGIALRAPARPSNPEFVETDIYPGFPTDLQSPLLAAACVAEGRLVLREKIFSNRFRIVEELKRMGAAITLKNDYVVIDGPVRLEGRNVIAQELRGGAALLIAGLAAEGITTVTDTRYIRRGYENIVGDLYQLGAAIVEHEEDGEE